MATRDTDPVHVDEPVPSSTSSQNTLKDIDQMECWNQLYHAAWGKDVRDFLALIPVDRGPSKTQVTNIAVPAQCWVMTNLPQDCTSGLYLPQGILMMEEYFACMKDVIASATRDEPLNLQAPSESLPRHQLPYPSAHLSNPFLDSLDDLQAAASSSREAFIITGQPGIGAPVYSLAFEVADS